MFNPDDYNDNIDYCRYVFEKNIELGLGLDSKQEIQFVANNYLDEIIAIRGFSDDEVHENEKILMGVVDKLAKKYKKFKSLSVKSELDNSLGELKDKIESDMMKKGGHTYSESYDDEDIKSM